MRPERILELLADRARARQRYSHAIYFPLCLYSFLPVCRSPIVRRLGNPCQHYRGGQSYLHPPASQVSSRKDLPRHSVGASPAPLSRAGTHTRLSSTSGRSLLEGNDRQPRSQSYTGLFKNFGGIGSRFKDMGRISKEFQGMEGKLNGKSCRPCILNMDQVGEGKGRGDRCVCVWLH